jgi:hypothetical protein
MGLRYSDELCHQLLEGIHAMRESTTYQAILREGRHEGVIEGGRRLLLRQGTKRFGPPDPATVAAIEGIQDPGRIEAVAERIIDPDVHGWDDLLREP